MALIRIGVTRNKGAKKPKADTIGVLKVPICHKELLDFCKSKLNIKSKSTNTRLFVCSGGGIGTLERGRKSGAGFEIKPDIDIDELNKRVLSNGILLCLSEKGSGYKDGVGCGGTKGTSATEELEQVTFKLSKPPRYIPGVETLKTTVVSIMNDSSTNNNDSSTNATINSSSSGFRSIDTNRPQIAQAQENHLRLGKSALKGHNQVQEVTYIAAGTLPSLENYIFHGPFPVIPSDVDMRGIMRETISLFGNNGRAGRGSTSVKYKTKSNSGLFQEIYRDGFIVYDYSSEGNLPPEFPNPLSITNKKFEKEKYQRALLRECRGLILCANTGQVLARRFHKSFNIDENDECRFDLVQEKLLSEEESAGNNGAASNAMCYEKIDGALCSPILIPSTNHNSNDNAMIIWATRRTRSSEIENYVSSMKGKIDYEAFALYAFKKLNATPLFEYCPETHIVAVVHHESTTLTFLTFRCNVTGKYFDMEDVVPMANDDEYPSMIQTIKNMPKAAKVCPVRDLKLFYLNIPVPSQSAQQKMESDDRTIVDVKNWGKGHEGVVIALSDGTRYKLKSNWYVAMAKASKLGGMNNFLPQFMRLLREKSSSLVALDQIPVDKLWVIALYDIDDVIAACVSELRHFTSNYSFEEDSCQLFLRFIRAVRKATQQLLYDLKYWAKDSFETVQSIDVVCRFACYHFGWPVDLIRAAIQCSLQEGTTTDDGGHDTTFEEYSRLMKNLLLSIAKDPCRGVEKLTYILGVKWHFGVDQIHSDSLFLAKYHIPEDEVLPSSFAKFVNCPAAPTADAIRNHVLEKYALKKIAKIMGEQDPSYIHIPRTYRSDEGRIKGLWEQFQRYDIIDLRVDLQSMNKNGPTSQEGNREYALFLVQFGLGLNKKVNSCNHRKTEGKSDYPKGDLAGVLLPTETFVSVDHFIEALATSLESQRMVRMQRRCVLLEGETLEDTFNNKDSKRQWVSPGKSAKMSIQQRPSTKKGLNWMVYCDLDGVLADFDKSVEQVTGTPPSDQHSKKMWRKILSQAKFFANLDLMPGAENMWAEICDVMRKLNEPNSNLENLKILTGLPMNCKNQINKDKRNWCAHHLFPKVGSSIEVITCLSQNKYQYSEPGRILIDDSFERKKDWAINGGIFIHHVSNERTLYELRRYVGLLREWVSEKFFLSLPIDGSKLKAVEINQNEVIPYNWISGDDIPFDISKHKFIGFDCEWNMHVSLVQLAVFSKCGIEVYLVDMLNAGPHLQSFVQKDICSNENITKIGFALDSDATQLQSHLKTVIDLQEVAMDLLDTQDWNIKGSHFGFDDMVQAILGTSIPKDKDLQHFNWEARPLSDLQMKYAAADSFYSLKMFQRIRDGIQDLVDIENQNISIESELLPPKHVPPRHASFERTHCSNKGASADDDWTFPDGAIVQPLYSGAFLSPASKQELIRIFKPKYQNIHYDHVTFGTNFTCEDRLQQIIPLVGKTCTILIDVRNVYDVEVVDCVKVESITLDETGKSLLPMVASGHPHITLSTHMNTRAKVSLDVIRTMETDQTFVMKYNEAENIGNILYLRAVIGLVVSENNDPLTGLTKKIKNQIHNFMSDKWITGEQLRFDPGELNAAERAIVHEFAERSNLESRSEGEKSLRKLTLVKRRYIDLSGIQSNNAKDDANCSKVYKCGNEAIDEKAHSQTPLDKKTKRVTYKSRCTKLHYDLGNGRVMAGSLFIDGTGIGDSLQPSHLNHVPLGSIIIETNGVSKIKWYGDYSNYNAQERLTNADVIILRGLPGSGKSSLSRSAEIMGYSNDEVVTCSADHFFENGAGMLNNRDKKRLNTDGVDIYSYVFSSDKIEFAHQYCWNSFEQATEDLMIGKIKRIIVDNTNSQKREYKKYEQYIIDQSLSFAIVEVTCSGSSQVSSFCQRSKHNVPERVCHAMFGRWECDERAFLFESLPCEEISMDSIINDSQKQFTA